MKNKAKVHRLPTEDKADIFKSKDLNIFHLRKNMYQFDDTKTDLISIHLYITTDEEIKEGDWYLNLEWNTIKQYQGEKISKSWNRKIIATTDPKLIISISKSMNKDKFPDITLPQIPQSFIEEYCKAGGIDEVLVEYDYPIKEWDKNDVPGLDNKVWITKLEPKLNPDNTIIIHPVEEKTYSRDEAIELIENYRIYAWKKGLTVNDFDKWIEENL